MRTEIFNPANGDRENVPNVAILITDGAPTKEVDGLDEEVARIKRDGVIILGVGVTNAVSERATTLYLLIKQVMYTVYHKNGVLCFWKW